jgi:hypothetical protein
MALQIRRGTNTERLGITPIEGEIIYVTDSQLVFTRGITITSTSIITTESEHGLIVNQPVKFISNTTNNITEQVVYYVKTVPTSTSFTISLTLGGAGRTNLTNGTGLDLQFAIGPSNVNGLPIGNSCAPVWVGDGVTVGGLPAGAAVLDDLADVTIGVSGLLGIAVDANQHLQYDNSTNQWRNVSNVIVPGTLDVYGNTVLHGAMNQIGDQTTDQLTLNGINVYAPNNLSINGPAANHIFVEYASGFVGIGKSNPVYKLDVDGSLRVVSNLWVNGNTNLGDGSGDSVTINASTVAIPNNLSFDSGLLKLDSANNWVGINQPSPSLPLDVIGAGKFSGDLAVNGGSLTTTFAGPFNLINSNATSVAFAGAATTLTIGAAGGESGGTTTIRNNAVVNGDFQVGASAQFTVDAGTGQVNVLATTQTTNQDSGALKVAGGVGIKKGLYVGGEVEIDSTAPSTDPDSGALRVDGGVGINGNINVGGSGSIGGNLTVTGDLTVNGTTTTLNTSTLEVEDKNIVVAKGVTTSAGADGAGFTIGDGAGVANFSYQHSSTRFVSSTGINMPGALIGNVNIASGVDDNTVTTSTGNLILDAATNIVEVNAALDVNSSLTADELTVDNVNINGQTIKSTTGNDLYITTTTARPTAGGAVIIPETSDFRCQATAITFGGGDLGGTQISYIGSVISDIVFAQPSSGYRGISGTAGGNDQWFVGGGQTGTDQGFLQLATGDNGTEPIYARQYSGNVNTGTLLRTAKILDESGNTVLPGALSISGDMFVENNKNLYVSGQSLVLNNNDTAGGDVELVSYRGTAGATSTSIRWNETTDRWTFTNNGSTFTNLPVATDSPSYAGATLGNIKVGITDDNTIDSASAILIKSDAGTGLTLNSTANISIGNEFGTATPSVGIYADSIGISGVVSNGITLDQQFIFEWDENSDRLNRPNFQSSSGNSSGIRVLAPVGTSSARASIGAFNTNDLNNGKFINIDARNTTNPLRIQTGQYVAGTIGNTSESVAFVNADSTVYASVNPGGVVNNTDLTTKTYVDNEVDLLQNGTTAFSQVNLASKSSITHKSLTTSATTAEQVLASWSASTYRSAKYQIQIESGTDYQVMEVMIVHNGTTAYLNTYSDIKTGSTDLATIGVTILSGNVTIQVTPANAVTYFNVVETLIKKA